MLTVHLRINDAVTGEPTPVRLRVTDAAGQSYAPLGRLTDFDTRSGHNAGGHVQVGVTRYVYIDGSCEIRLPPGLLHVEASRGPEYTPLSRAVELGPGQLSLRLSVDRWTDLRAQGWYSGDTRVTDLSTEAALLEAAAEDVAILNLLAYERPPQGEYPPALPGLLAFSGTRPAREAGGHLVAVNTLNYHPVLGAVGLLNCHRVVYPLRSGEPGADDWSVADWCDQCHRKSGLVVWPHLPRLHAECLQGEALAAAILGKIDAFEIAAFEDPESPAVADWYRVLDTGRRIPLVGGSGKDGTSTAVGAVRTYARLAAGEAFGYGPWIEAVRAGRTFATNGPLLMLTADGHGPGAALERPPGGSVPIRVEARSAVPFEQVQVIYNGRVVDERSAAADRFGTVLETEVSLEESGWIAARCWSAERLFDGRQCVYAHTSPVYVTVPDHPRRPSPASLVPLAEILDHTAAWVEWQADCEPRHRERLLGVLTSAREELHRQAGPVA